MICEFALDPELVATWHDRKKFLFFEEKFGIRTRRIVSLYPRKWRSLVWRMFNRSPHAQNPIAQARLSALLDDLCQNAVKRRGSFPEILDWLERAEAEHSERPFHGIVATMNPRHNSNVIRSAELIETGHDLWSVPDECVVPRNPQEIVKAVAPLLRICRHAVFVDPYFEPKASRFTEPFASFMEQIWTYRRGIEEPEVELHTGIERFFRNGEEPNPEEERRVTSELLNNMKNKLPRLIPAGRKVQVYLWKQREHGEKLHNRYILSEIAGILFGTGLDKAKDRESVETDDLRLLSSSQLDVRWKQYKGSPGAFDPVTDHPIEIIGSA